MCRVLLWALWTLGNPSSPNPCFSLSLAMLLVFGQNWPRLLRSLGVLRAEELCCCCACFRRPKMVCCPTFQKLFLAKPFRNSFLAQPIRNSFWVQPIRNSFWPNLSETLFGPNLSETLFTPTHQKVQWTQNLMTRAEVPDNIKHCFKPKPKIKHTKTYVLKHNQKYNTQNICFSLQA